MAEPASGSAKSSVENETTGEHLSLPANTMWPEGASETIHRLPRAASEETVRPWRIRCAAELRRRNPSAARPAVFASTVSACIDKAAAATIDEITNAVLQKRIATLPMVNGCILPFLHSRRNYELRSSRYQREKSIICNPCFLPNMKAPELRADGRSCRG